MMAAFKYNEILKLKDMLMAKKIPFEEYQRNNGLQITYPSKEFVCSAIEFDGSYGSVYDLIEIMGLVSENESEDSVLGWLSAEEVFRRIESHWKAQMDGL